VSLFPGRRNALLAALVAGVVSTAGGSRVGASPSQPYDLAADVPTTLGALTATTNQAVRRPTAGSYSVVLDLPADVALSAVERRAFDGGWLFSPANPWSIGATTFLPNDVVRWNGTTFFLALPGTASGIPTEARIDAISEIASGALELSFDVPVRIGAADYGRSDLVLYTDGVGYALAWSAASAGVPDYANLVGSSRDASGARVLAFDVPVTLGANEYLPGDLVRWTAGAGFEIASHDPGWPVTSEPRDFTSIPPVGGVPESPGGGTPLTIAKAGAAITLAWGEACGASAITDYAVYEGTIGSWYSHFARYCSTNGSLSSSFVPPAGDVYYVVAARNGPAEGSLGRDSSGVEIPQAPNACVPQQLATCP
jgi:hypothetical protein